MEIAGTVTAEEKQVLTGLQAKGYLVLVRGPGYLFNLEDKPVDPDEAAYRCLVDFLEDYIENARGDALLCVEEED